MIALCLSLSSFAQEENVMVVKEGTRYIDIKVKALDKYDSRLKHQQEHLLNKLKRKEKHFADKLKNTDSVAYAAYQKDATISFDSISKLSKDDTGANAKKIAKRKNSAVDSLKRIASFVQNKSGLSTSGSETPNTGADLNQMQGKLNYKAYINDLITKRTADLKNLATTNSNIPGFTGIEKQVFYAKAKMKVFKEMEDDPTIAEDKAMEYLQGTAGFDKSMNSGGSTAGQSLGNDASDAEMAKMGYQTKGLVQSSMSKTFGENLGGVAKQLNSGLNNYKNGLNDASQSKQSLSQLKGIDKPSFKVNPMRELPFWKRVEKQYNFQTTRATEGGTQPAMLNISAMAGFKQTLKLTYGLGLVTAFGLGQSWTNLHFSFQGIGLRSFVTWQWQYGIGFYTGYERMYKQVVFTDNNQSSTSDAIPSPHNTTDYTESVLIGLTKSYKLNSKYNGQLQILYDVWWQQKGLSSPMVLRFATITK